MVDLRILPGSAFGRRHTSCMVASQQCHPYFPESNCGLRVTVQTRIIRSDRPDEAVSVGLQASPQPERRAGAREVPRNPIQ
jgi:hypothetical protein